MRTLFWTTLVLGLCFTTPLHAQDGPPDPPVERQVIVMFETDAAALPDGATRAEIGQAQLPGPVKGLLQRAGAQRMAKGFPDFRRADTLRVLENGRTYRVPDYTNLFVVTLPLNANRDSVVARLNRLPEWVKYAEKNQRPAARISPGATPGLSLENRSHTIRSHTQNGTDEVIPPNQDDFDKQWGLRNTSGPDIEATKAWTYTKGSSNITVGVVDSGVEGSHIDLSGKVGGYTSPSTSHGTSVAGIAAAKGDNSSGKVAGVDWRAQIHSEQLSGDLVSTAQSIDDAVTAGASVINNSWGFADRSTTLTQALRSAYEADVLLVHANPYKTGSDADTSPYPNNVGPWVINVGAMTQSGTASSYTGSRSFTDVGAPGNDIRTTVLGNDTDDRTGTSFAAPFVTGTASLLLSVEASLRTHDIEHILERTAQSYGSGRDPEIGYGMIDANAAVTRVSDPYEVTHGTASFTKIYDDDNVSFPDGFTKDNGTHYGAGTYICDIYELSASASSPDFYYEEKPWFWLPVTEKGFSAANPNDGDRYLSKSVSKSSAEATTYFYNCSNTLGQNIGWVPFDPTVHKQNGDFEYTVIGKPDTPPVEVTLSGPSALNSGEQGTWTANTTGGSGSLSYQWYEKYEADNTFNKIYGATSASYSTALYGNVTFKVEVTADNSSDSDTHAVSVDCDRICVKSFAEAQELETEVSATATAETVEVTWQADGVPTHSAFAVQHRADSTASWSTLGTVAAGDSTSAGSPQAVAYRFQTDKLEIGTHQFRVGWPREAGPAPRAADNSETSASRRYTKPVTAKIEMDEAYRLSAYPNPVRQQATVELAVQERQNVQVHLYDVLGRRVATLHDGPLPAQELERLQVNVSATGLTSGTYFLRVTGENFATTEQITVVR